MTFRTIQSILAGVPTMEGAGVRLQRIFGYHESPRLDPFLLLDHFGSSNPDDYLAGFPWHPHRGIETVTYVRSGSIEHGDSLGNTGVINSGDVQWMTAGSGIIHQEMPQRAAEPLQGFQLWVNLPRAQKMMPPRYNEITQRQIPTVAVADAVQVKVISGTLDGTPGPMQDLMVAIEYLDVEISGPSDWNHPITAGFNALAYVYEGEGLFDVAGSTLVQSSRCVHFSADGDAVQVKVLDGLCRFLLISGKPLQEPVAWRGPIVMNTHEELHTAFAEFHAGTFIKHKP